MTVVDVTREWLQAALAQRHPEVRLRAVAIREVIAGSATKVLLDVEYDDAAGLTTALCLKGGFDEVMRELAWHGYLTEARFFGTVAADLAAPVPRSYVAKWDEDQRQGLVLFENLVDAGCTFNPPTAAISPDMAAEGLDVLARLHGQHWGATPAGPLDWLTIGSPGLKHVIDYLTGADYWDSVMASREHLVPVPLRDRDRVKAAVVNLWTQEEHGPYALLHGDAHLGNTYLDPHGALRFADWQTVMLGHWAHDVATFLAGSLDVDDRRSSERDLLNDYLERLSTYGGPGLDKDQAWDAYRRNIIHGYLWILTPVEMQPEENCRVMGQRFGTAADDLGTLALLETR